MINIGIVGANDLSKKHINKLIDMKEFNVVGFFEKDDDGAEHLSKSFKINRFHSFENLLNHTDAIDILTPVGSHYQYASEAIRNMRHVMVKQVISENLYEARELNQLADEANVQLHVSHHEKFHPNYQLLKKLLVDPFYIESFRFDANILNYSIENMVFDLLLNELKLVLNIVNGNIRKVRATGACLHHNYVDFINVRLEFDNGCILNMVCGNFKSEQKNQLRFFQKNKTYALNLDNFKLSVLNTSEPEADEQLLNNSKKNGSDDTIKKELVYFAQSISGNALNLRTHYDNFQTLEVAHEIIQKLKINKR
ncbi:MAG: Gfo/Idh/MocA family protein [Bacteroidia bacterium]